LRKSAGGSPGLPQNLRDFTRFLASADFLPHRTFGTCSGTSPNGSGLLSIFPTKEGFPELDLPRLARFALELPRCYTDFGLFLGEVERLK